MTDQSTEQQIVDYIRRLEQQLLTPVHVLKYNHNVEEEEYQMISFHRTIEGAYKALIAHKDARLAEHIKNCPDGINASTFGFYEDWKVEVLEIGL